ncbi:MAG: hypothetical protein Q8P41_25700 [Pseudomonadota bacterium]|nr:hypothetical protein [Pseudomonadota bacterium]
MTTPRPSSSRPNLPLVLGVIACAACCSIPLLAALGVGSGVLGLIAGVAEPVGLFFLVVGAVVSAFAYFGVWRKRTTGGASCGSAVCNAAGACGCKPSVATSRTCWLPRSE